MMSAVGDRTLFIGSRIPHNVKTLSSVLPSINQATFRSLLKLCITDLEGRNVTPEMYQNIKDASSNTTNVDLIYSALYLILKSALKLPQSVLKKEIFVEDLLELKIPQDYVADLAQAVYGIRRSIIDESILKTAPRLLKLEKLKWRVDVTISTSSLSRVLEPTLLMEIHTSDGRKLTFEVQKSQFHRLRFAIASLLKEVALLEQRNVIKMQL